MQVMRGQCNHASSSKEVRLLRRHCRTAPFLVSASAVSAAAVSAARLGMALEERLYSLDGCVRDLDVSENFSDDWVLVERLRN